MGEINMKETNQTLSNYKHNTNYVYIFEEQIKSEKNIKLKQFLKYYHINLYIDDTSNFANRKELINATDIIFILSENIIINDDFIEILNQIIHYHKNFLILYFNDLDIEDLLSFFPNVKNLNLIKCDKLDLPLLTNILFYLNTFKKQYQLLNKEIDKTLKNDIYFVLFLKYLINFKIYKKEDILKVLPITNVEYLKYYKILKDLMIINIYNEETYLLDEYYISEYLPLCYKEVFKKNTKQIDLYQIFDNIYNLDEEIKKKLSHLSYEEFNKEFQKLYDSYRNKTIITNRLITVLNELEVLRIIDNNLIFNVSFKDIITVKNYLISILYKNNQSNLIIKNRQIYIYSTNNDDKRIKYFINWHKHHDIIITNDFNNNDLIIFLVTSSNMYNKELLDLIRTSVENKRKILFIYIDKLQLNLKIQYLIKFYPDICYWAYKRIDYFYEKYEEKLTNILDKEINNKDQNIFLNINKLN